MMRESIQECCGHTFALENLTPIAEGQIAGDQQASSLVTVGKNLEQQFHTRSAERQITQLIDNQQIELVEFLQQPIQNVLLPRFFQLIDQRRRREELCLHPFTTSGQTQCNRQMRFSRSRLADQTNIGMSLDPFATGQFQHLLFAHRPNRREVVTL